MVTIARRWVAILPFVCSIVTFSLAMVILFAGNKPGYMEDVAIIKVIMTFSVARKPPRPTADSAVVAQR